MFVINADKSIHLTRGDIASIVVSADESNDKAYIFQVGDVVRLRVYEHNHHENVVLSKDVTVNSESQVVEITLTKEDTKIGELINKPVDYWYELELNPDTAPQTMIGYDSSGPKIFRLFPEGGEKM